MKANKKHMNYSQTNWLMENSIRDIFIFLKLNRGLENDNTLFKKRKHVLIYQNLNNDNTLFHN